MHNENYIERVRRETAERRAQRAAAAEARAKGEVKATTPTATERQAQLRAEVQRWYGALAPEDRRPRYLLTHIAPLFRCTPQQLGIVLHDLGWRRKRAWRDDEPHHRYWLPPDAEAGTRCDAKRNE